MIALACSGNGASDDALPEGPFTTVSNGSSIAYEVAGQGESAVVFIHGGLNDRAGWNAAMGAFSGRSRVVSLDPPGHGESAPLGDYPPAAFSDAVLAVMDDAEIDDAVLVGHSFGVSVARDVALTVPNRVTGLFMLDGFLVPLGGDPELGAAVLAQFESDEWPAAAETFVEQFMFGANTPDSVKAVVRESMLSAPQELWLAVLRIAVRPEIERDVVVPVPTHATFLPGLTLPPDYESYLLERFPDLEFDLQPEGTGHFIMLERPEAFHGALEGLRLRVGSD